MKTTIVLSSIIALLFACQKPDAELQKPHNLYMSNQMPCTYGGDTIEANPEIPLPSTVWKDTVNLLINEGQSNASGRIYFGEFFGNATRKMIFGKDTAFVQAYSTSTQNAFDVMNISLNTSDVANRAGVQPLIARAFMEKYHQHLYVYQIAQGGRKITEFLTPGSGLNNYLLNLKNVLNKFESDSIYVNILGIIWNQGESDGGAIPGKYSSSLTDLYNLNMQIIGKRVPFFVVQLQDTQTKVVALSGLQNEQAQWVLNHPGTTLVPKYEAATTPDGYHYTLPTVRFQADFIFNKLFTN